MTSPSPYFPVFSFQSKPRCIFRAITVGMNMMKASCGGLWWRWSLLLHLGPFSGIICGNLALGGVLNVPSPQNRRGQDKNVMQGGGRVAKLQMHLGPWDSSSSSAKSSDSGSWGGSKPRAVPIVEENFIHWNIELCGWAIAEQMIWARSTFYEDFKATARAFLISIAKLQNRTFLFLCLKYSECLTCE